MSFYRTAAPSSRITKPGRKKSLPFPTGKRKSSDSSKAVKRALETEHTGKDLEYHGSLESPESIRAKIAPGLLSTRVEDIMSYFQSNIFTDVPNRAPGMNSTRIAEVLNFRIRLPPIVPVAHVHAITTSPTSTEREIAAKLQAGILRRVVIPNRGVGAKATGDCLVLVSEWEKVVRSNTGLSNDLKEKYIAYLKNISTSPFSPNDIKTLLRAGLLTASASHSSISDTFIQPHTTSIGTLAFVAEAGQRHASGTDFAAGYRAIDHTHGGVGAANRLSGNIHVHKIPYNLALPNTGPFLQLLTTARAHLLSLLSKSGPYKSMPLERLRERWDGGASDPDKMGEDVAFKGISPGKTRKWKDFYGLRFEWILAEAIGAGLVECFRTGSVGTGIRIV